MITIGLDPLRTFLEEKGYSVAHQKETGQLLVVFKTQQQEFPLFIRCCDEDHLLQLIVFIPTHLYEETFGKDLSMKEKIARRDANSALLGDMARLLHLMNKEFDLPGFGMDELEGAVFYRLVIPTPKKKIEGDLLLALMKTVEHVCTHFTIPIQALNTKKMTLQQILDKANELKKS